MIFRKLNSVIICLQSTYNIYVEEQSKASLFATPFSAFQVSAMHSGDFYSECVFQVNLINVILSIRDTR